MPIEDPEQQAADKLSSSASDTGAGYVDELVTYLWGEALSGDEAAVMKARFSLSLPELVSTESWVRMYGATYTRIPGKQLNVFHAEPNLDLAANLLERGLALHREWFDMRLRFLDRLAQHKAARVRHRLLLTQAREKVFELSAAARDLEAKASQTDADTKADLERLQRALNEKYHSAKHRLGTMRELNDAALILETEGSTNAGKTPMTHTGCSIPWQGPGGAKYAQELEAKPTSIILNARYAQHLLRGIRMDQEADAAAMSLRSLEGSKVSGQFEWQAAQKEADFATRKATDDAEDAELVDLAFEEERTALATGYLNVVEKLRGLEARYFRDFGEAMELVSTAHTGLTAIFGETCAGQLPPDADQAKRDYYDRVLVWVRECISVLLLRSRHEQSVMMSLSVASLIGEDTFQEAIGGADPIRANISEETVLMLLGAKSMYSCRVRGVSAFIRFTEPAHNGMLFRVALTPPSESRFTHATGQPGLLGRTPNPPCVLARVTNRAFQREPDLGGLSTLFNCSPYGEWTIDIAPSAVARGVTRANIADIEIDLHLSAQVTGV